VPCQQPTARKGTALKEEKKTAIAGEVEEEKMGRVGKRAQVGVRKESGFGKGGEGALPFGSLN